MNCRVMHAFAETSLSWHLCWHLHILGASAKVRTSWLLIVRAVLASYAGREGCAQAPGSPSAQESQESALRPEGNIGVGQADKWLGVGGMEYQSQGWCFQRTGLCSFYPNTVRALGQLEVLKICVKMFKSYKSSSQTRHHKACSFHLQLLGI